MNLSTDLLHPVAEIVRQFMIAQGEADDPLTLNSSSLPIGSWPAYKGVEPSSPDNCITVFTTLGNDAGRTMGDGEVASFFGFQIRVRAVDDVVGFAKASALRTWLQKQVYANSITIDSAQYLIPAFSGIGQVLELSRDRPPTGRFVCTLNAVAAIRVIVTS